MKYEKPEINIHSSTDVTEWAVPKSSYTAQQSTLYACGRSSSADCHCSSSGSKAKTTLPKNNEMFMAKCHCTSSGARVSYGKEKLI